METYKIKHSFNGTFINSSPARHRRPIQVHFRERKVLYCIQISLKFVQKGPIEPALVQVYNFWPIPYF